MSYADAMRDGIRVAREHGQSVYYPRCQFCGLEVRSWNYLAQNRYTCKQCRPHKRLLQKVFSGK